MCLFLFVNFYVLVDSVVTNIVSILQISEIFYSTSNNGDLIW